MTKRIKKTMVALMVVLAMVITPVTTVKAAAFTEAAEYTYNGQKLSITSMGQIVYTTTDGRTKELTREKLGLVAAFSNDGIVYYEMLNKSIYFYSFELQGIDGEPMLYERNVTELELTGSGENTRITGYKTKSGSQPLITMDELKLLLSMASNSSSTSDNGSSSSSNNSSSTSDNASSSSVSNSSSTSNNSSSSSVSNSSSTSDNASSSSVSNSSSTSKNSTVATFVIKPTKTVTTTITKKEKYKYAKKCVVSKKNKNKILLKDSRKKTVDQFIFNRSCKKLTYKNKKYKKVSMAYFNEKGNLIFISNKALKVVNHITGKVRLVKKGVKGICFVKKTRIAKKYILKSGKKKSLRKL